MTYQDLYDAIAKMNGDQLQQDVTIAVDDEYFAISSLVLAAGDDVLDDGHPFLLADTSEERNDAAIAARQSADHIDGYDRDDLGESQD